MVLESEVMKMKKVLKLKSWVKVMITIILLVLSLFLYVANGFDNVNQQQITWFFIFPFIGCLLLYLWEE